MTLADRLRADLMRRDPALDHDGDSDWDDLRATPAHGWRQAAVLVAVTDRVDPGVILTQRTDAMRNHAGQIAFPGGRVDAGDRDVVAAALREAEEEVALAPGDVTVVGTGGRYRTITGFEVTPVIGVVPPGLDLSPNPLEVAAVFEVPLAHLVDPANHMRGALLHQGQRREFWEIGFEGRHIWGATAAMIVNLSRRLQWRA